MAGLLAALRGCHCVFNFVPGDSVTERHPERSWRKHGEVRPGHAFAIDHVVVEWYAEPELTRIVAVSMARLRHDGPCPPPIEIGMRVRVTGSALGLRRGAAGRVTGVSRSGIVTVQADSGEHAETWRSQLAPIAS